MQWEAARISFAAFKTSSAFLEEIHPVLCTEFQNVRICWESSPHLVYNSPRLRQFLEGLQLLQLRMDQQPVYPEECFYC